MKRIFAILLTLLITSSVLAGCGSTNTPNDDVIVLRISNWEEYIDLGDWDEEEVIELDDKTAILGVNPLYEDFEDWFYEKYGRVVRVEYSTFGTNEELYNQLTIGDVYDLVCPSEYMIMKMMREDMLVPFSEDFYDMDNEDSVYIRNVSPYIEGVFDELTINDEKLSDYAAGYMWGTLGIVYNPDEVSEEEAAHWDLLLNPKFNKRVTVKDSVRDAYFGAISYARYDEITSDEFLNSPDYNKLLSDALNDTSPDMVNLVEDVLTRTKNNVYAFETDAGKADLVTGKVVANEQWSGDAVYTMDQADEDGVELCYSAPEEGTNLWFDGWVMLRCGIEEDSDKQFAAQEFINFVSKPENAIRNMYYIGYTSSIAGGDSSMIYDYIDWCYGAEEDEEEVIEYPIGYFFDPENENADDEYTITTTPDQANRQLYAQYPSKDVVDRSVVMECFEDEDNERINRMWTNVRCFDLKSIFK